MTATTAGTLPDALRLAGIGWPVLPLHTPSGPVCSCEKGADCKSAGKHPRNPRGSSEATADEATVRGWWRRWREANLGVATGAEYGKFMVGPDGAAGLEALAGLERRHGLLPVGPWARSGNAPGRHHYFRYPAGAVIANSRNHRGLPIDVRGDGGLAVAPPSLHTSGLRYEWEIFPWAADLPEAPAWLVEWCQKEYAQAESSRHNGEGYDHASPDVTRRALAYLAKCPPAVSGCGGHDRTFAVARAVVYGFDLGPEVGFRLLAEAYNPRCEPPWSERELRHKCEDADTKPCRKPRGWLRDEPPPQRNGFHGQKGTAPGQAGASVGSVGGKKRYRPLPAYRPFPISSLPPVLAEMVPAAAEAIGCDPGLVACPALAVVAGCVGNARALVLKRGWIEPAVVWALTVADSGGHKTPAYLAAVQPLTDLQLELWEQYQERVRGHKKELEDYAQLVQELKRKRQSIQGLVKPPAPEEPPAYITTDPTIEALGGLLADNPHGLLLARDELDAWFQSFTRYKGKGTTDRPQWLELHRAGTLINDRATRERKRFCVRRAAVSITGTIQPAVLARALDLDALQAGVGARFLLNMPPRRRRVWTEKELPDDLAESYRRLLMDLLGLPLADAGRRKPHYLGLSEAARRLWIDFYNEWGQVQQDAEGEQAAAFAKIEAYGARLMLLHHVITEIVLGGPRVPPGEGRHLPPVTEASARAGIELARWFAAEAERVYGMLHDTQEERETRRLVEWIGERGGRVTVRQLQHSNSRKWPTKDLAEAALNDLAQAGLGHWEEHPAPQGGHPTRWFVLTLPTSDTSDTRPDGEGEPAGQASDTCSDTRPPGASREGSPFRGTAWGGTGNGHNRAAPADRVSEVSDAEASGAPASAPLGPEDRGEQVSEGHGDAWEG